MDLKLSLNLGQEGYAQVSKTKKISGKLHSVIISFEGFPIKLSIKSELGYKILEIPKFQHEEGYTTYIPIQVRPLDNKGHGTNYSNEEYELDESLSIEIEGSKNQEIEVIIRYG